MSHPCGSRTIRHALAAGAVFGLLAGAACSGPATPSTLAAVAVANPTITAVDRGTLGVSPSTALFIPGQTELYVALPEQIFTRELANVTWSVDDPAVASVTPDGHLVALAPGFTWLRAKGADGTAAHPISVDRDPPVEASGRAVVESCTSEFDQACKGRVSPSQFDLYLKYRVVRNNVIAETWWGNDLNTSALAGSVLAPGQFRFFEPAFFAPVVSRGAGGCCSRLFQVEATASGARLTAGTLVKVSSSSTIRIRIVTP
jgi:hypothetical protein